MELKQPFPGTKANNSHIDEIEVSSRLINMVLDMPVAQQLDLLNTLDTTGFKGSRKQPRTALKNPWVVVIDPETKNESYSHHIQDISRCGMFIESDRSFGVGENVMLTFQMPASRKLFKLVGEVVRLQKNGIGVKFKRQFAGT